MVPFNIYLVLIVISLLVIVRLKLIRLKKKKTGNLSLLKRFKNRFTNRNRIREKISEKFSYTLISDPEVNIAIGPWYSEIELREKADIHRARLSKYGKSKMNGEMLFLGPKGGVYKFNADGKKKYL